MKNLWGRPDGVAGCVSKGGGGCGREEGRMWLAVVSSWWCGRRRELREGPRAGVTRTQAEPGDGEEVWRSVVSLAVAVLAWGAGVRLQLSTVAVAVGGTTVGWMLQGPCSRSKGKGKETVWALGTRGKN